MLDNYYTANGFISSEYDRAINNPEILEKYAENVYQIYVEAIEKYNALNKK